MTFEEPNPYLVEIDLAHRMIVGLIDRMLEYGYITAFRRCAAEERPIYSFCKRVGEDHVTIEVEEQNPEVSESVFWIIRRNHDPHSWYKIKVTINPDLRIKDVMIEVSNHTVLEVACDMHRVMSRIRSTHRWDGSPYNERPVNLELCCQGT